MYPGVDFLPWPFEQVRHHADIAGDGPVGEQPGALYHVAHIEAQLLGIHVVNIFPVYPDIAAAVGQQAVDHPQRGGFTAAGAADQHAHFAGFDGQVDMINGGDIAESSGDTFEFDHPVCFLLRQAVVSRLAGMNLRLAPSIENRASAASASKIVGNAPSNTRSIAAWPSP